MNTNTVCDLPKATTPEFAKDFRSTDLSVWKEAIYNRVYQHFIVEMRPRCFDQDYERCVMVGKDGNRCAFSCLLPTEWSNHLHEYDRTGSVLSQLYQHPMLREYFGIDTRPVPQRPPGQQSPKVEFLMDLQLTHDQLCYNETNETWSERWAKFGLDHNLKVPHIHK